MTTAEKPLVELVQELPPELQARVRSYVTLLLAAQKEGVPGAPLRQSWAGILRDIDRYVSSVELQHRAADWMAVGIARRADDDVSPCYQHLARTPAGSGAGG